MIGSSTPGHGQRQHIDDTSVVHASGHMRAYQSLVTSEGWQKLLLPRLNARLQELSNAILDAQDLDPATLDKLRQQRWALKDFFASLCKETEHQQAVLDRRDAEIRRPASSDQPMPELFKAMGAVLPDPGSNITLGDLAGAHFNPFHKKE